MNLASYLESKHMEYINKVGDVVYESDWIKTVLNPRLPKGDRFSIASFNQWMNDDRKPDGRNIIRLATVFGPEILPYLGIRFDSDILSDVLVNWESLPEEEKNEIHARVMRHNKE